MLPNHPAVWSLPPIAARVSSVLGPVGSRMKRFGIGETGSTHPLSPSERQGTIAGALHVIKPQDRLGIRIQQKLSSQQTGRDGDSGFTARFTPSCVPGSQDSFYHCWEG